MSPDRQSADPLAHEIVTLFQMGDMTYDVHDGVAMLLDRTSFAGSSTLLNQMIGILTEAVGIPLPEAIRMGSLTPATVIGCWADSR